MTKTKKFFLIPILSLAIVLGGAHALASNRANEVAKELVNELVNKINQHGGEVSVGEVIANPYNKNIAIKDVQITDDLDRTHHIGLLTLTDIELNSEQDFIYAMNVSTLDALFTVTGGAGTSEQEQTLKNSLQQLGISEDKIGHDQHLAYRYQPDLKQLTLTLQNQFYNPELKDKEQSQLFTIDMHTAFSQIPDLENQVQRLRNNEDITPLVSQWMKTGLIRATLAFADKGAWQPLIEQGAAKADVTENTLKNHMTQQFQQYIQQLKILSPSLQSQIMEAGSQFIDSVQPELTVDIESKNPQGTGMMLTFMTMLMSPTAVESQFNIQIAGPPQ